MVSLWLEHGCRDFLFFRHHACKIDKKAADSFVCSSPAFVHHHWLLPEVLPNGSEFDHCAFCTLLISKRSRIHLLLNFCPLESRIETPLSTLWRVPVLGGSKNDKSAPSCVLVLFVRPLKNSTDKFRPLSLCLYRCKDDLNSGESNQPSTICTVFVVY